MGFGLWALVCRGCLEAGRRRRAVQMALRLDCWSPSPALAVLGDALNKLSSGVGLLANGMPSTL